MGKGERQLLDQIEFLFMVWTRYGHSSDQTAAALNGLFDLAKKRDKDGMNSAFARGLDAIDATKRP